MTILDHTGAPLKREVKVEPMTTLQKSFTQAINTYFQSLANTRMPAIVRAREPFQNHAWIFAAAMAIATTASQAPLKVFQEDALLRGSRGFRSKTRGRYRRAMQRHQRGLKSRFFLRGIEEVEDHPLVDVFDAPNPYQDLNQLQQLTILWIAVRGECFWVMTGPDGAPLLPGQFPAQIWPIGPDLMSPVWERGSHGRLIGWRMQYTDEFPRDGQEREAILTLNEVVQFKYPNITTLVRGMSRLTPVAQNVESDMLINTMNRSILEKQGVPRGVLEFDGVLDKEHREELEQTLRDKYEGAEQAGRLAVISGGFKFNPVSLTPQEMAQMEHLKWNRETELGAMGTPPSVLGVTEFTNYATQLGQDKNFWDKTLLPLFRMIESAVDKSVFFLESDRTFALFDVSEVEALRAGVIDKIEQASKLSEEYLHCPPRVAYEVVGLEVPEYAGDDVAIIKSLSAQTVQQIMDESVTPEDDDFKPHPEDNPEAVDDIVDDSTNTKASRFKGQGGKAWKAFIALQTPHEKRFRGRWRNWVNSEKKLTLERFDEQAAAEAKGGDHIYSRALDVELVLGELRDSQSSLLTQVRPLYGGMLEDTFAFTVEEIGGVAEFAIDDESILQFFEERERVLTQTAPSTLRAAVSRTMSEGIAAGESMSQLRIRIARVYNVSAGSAKTLQVARTESASFMSGVRNRMFKLQGFQQLEWVTAGDEHVRDSHVTFGAAGVQDEGFNYMTLSTGNGILEYPGDSRAPAKEVINCRCVQIPVR